MLICVLSLTRTVYCLDAVALPARCFFVRVFDEWFRIYVFSFDPLTVLPVVLLYSYRTTFYIYIFSTIWVLISSSRLCFDVFTCTVRSTNINTDVRDAMSRWADLCRGLPWLCPRRAMAAIEPRAFLHPSSPSAPPLPLLLPGVYLEKWTWKEAGMERGWVLNSPGKRRRISCGRTEGLEFTRAITASTTISRYIREIVRFQKALYYCTDQLIRNLYFCRMSSNPLPCCEKWIAISWTATSKQSPVPIEPNLFRKIS